MLFAGPAVMVAKYVHQTLYALNALRLIFKKNRDVLMHAPPIITQVVINVYYA